MCLELDPQDSKTLDRANLAMKEKNLMVAIGQELLELAKPYDYQTKIDELAFGKKGLEFIEHLSNLAGFCDKNAQQAIAIAVRYLSTLIIDPNQLFSKTHLKAILPLVIGIQVDFNRKPPFRAFGFDAKALGAQLTAKVER